MSWALLRSIQKQTDTRLILPFGLALDVGDVISVDRRGIFQLEGKSKSLLGIPVRIPQIRKSAGGGDGIFMSDDDIKCTFRAAGEASTLFPQLPSATAGFDISFGSHESWILAQTGRELTSFPEVNQLRQPILEAYLRGVWLPDWAVVTSVAYAERMTLLAANARNTQVSLSISGDVATGTPMEAQLTAGVSVAATNQKLTQFITDQRMPVGVIALRVKDPWWRNASVGNLQYSAPPSTLEEAERAPDDAFWEDVDEH